MDALSPPDARNDTGRLVKLPDVNGINFAELIGSSGRPVNPRSSADQKKAALVGSRDQHGWRYVKIAGAISRPS